MSKNNNSKEKPSFWKKLGLGKKTSTTTASSLRSEQQDNHDKSSVKSKRLSGMFQIVQNDPLPPPLPLPTKTIKKQPRVNLLKVMDDNNIISNFHQQHVEENHSNPTTEVDISGESIVVTPTADILHQESTTIDEKNRAEQKDSSSTIVYSTEQPNVTPAPVIKKKNSSDDENNSNSSFVVVKSNNNSSPVVVQQQQQESIITNNKNDELLAIISKLKVELENEKTTVNVLQKQKEAVAKDLDYLELSVDELFSEKTDLLQQLEDEKIKSQQYLDDLNLSLEKQKSTADNARDQSFVVDQTKLEFEAYQEQCRQEQQELLSDIATKDKTIRELKSKLSKSQEQVETLKVTMDQLIKSHAAEISRTTAQATADKEKSQLPLHTPNGSPRIKPAEEEEDWNQTSSPIIPVPSSSTPFHNNDHYGKPQSMTRMDSSDIHHRTQKESVDYMDATDLDDQLVKLLKEKEKLQSYYSKIPLTGGGPQSRRRKEELEAMLDQVDSQLSKVKQKIRRS